MKNLVLMRHGKSSWKDKELSDFDRPLKKRGKSDTPVMGKLLWEEGFEPDLVLSSSAVRCVETVDLLYESLHLSDEIVKYKKEFYQAEVDDYLHVLTGLDNSISNVLFVGHNPSLETLLQHLTGDIEVLSTAAVAWIKLPIQTWIEAIGEDFQGSLVGIWRPKEIRE